MPREELGSTGKICYSASDLGYQMTKLRTRRTAHTQHSNILVPLMLQCLSILSHVICQHNIWRTLHCAQHFPFPKSRDVKGFRSHLGSSPLLLLYPYPSVPFNPFHLLVYTPYMCRKHNTGHYCPLLFSHTLPLELT